MNKKVFPPCSRGWGYCLENEPEYNEDYKKYQEYSYRPPGVIYDANHQCRLQYNHDAEYCSGIDVSLKLI